MIIDTEIIRSFGPSGMIVIPIAIMTHMKICAGTMMEISYDKDNGTIILKKVGNNNEQ